MLVACFCCLGAGWNAGLWMAAVLQGHEKRWLYPIIIIVLLGAAVANLWVGLR